VKAVRFTKAELSCIRAALEFVADVQADARAASGVLAKLDAAEVVATPNAAVGPIEEALMAGARGKVIALDRTGYGRASVQAGRLGVTPADARVVGEWIARQGWLHGPQTLLDVLNKWPAWVSKARATQPPPSAQPGFGDGVQVTGATTGPGTNGPGQGSSGGRPARGFGRKVADPHPDGVPGDR
jgi:hypothetical protein